MPKPTGPSISSVVAQVAAQLEAPISFDAFAQRILDIKPSTAKNPKAGIRNELGYNLLEHNLVYLDDRKQLLAPLKRLIPGVRFRHVVSEQEVENGLMLLDRNNCAFLPGRAYTMPQTILTIILLDEAGQSIPVQFGSISEQIQSFFDKEIQTVERPGIQLTDWFLQHAVKADDSILLTKPTKNSRWSVRK